MVTLYDIHYDGDDDDDYDNYKHIFNRAHQCLYKGFYMPSKILTFLTSPLWSQSGQQFPLYVANLCPVLRFFKHWQFI
jgi:hypothetical protein